MGIFEGRGVRRRLAATMAAILVAFVCAAGLACALEATGARWSAETGGSENATAYAAEQGWRQSVRNGAQRWWYRYADGSYARGWTRINDTWYCFDTDGWMRTGWVRDNGRWYYLRGSGALATGWQNVGGVWYYLTKSGQGTEGAMRTGWLSDGGRWYYLDGSGAMRTGWVQVSQKWYYMESSGAMRANAWVQGRYYVQADGSMAVSRWVDGNRYFVDENGCWVPGKVKAAVPLYTEAGALHVSGTHLADAAGNVVQLRGVSTHGLAWFPQYVSKDAFKTLRDDWGANVVRLAMYTGEYGGYCNGGDRAQLEALIDTGVRAATDLGMYVIIDWHLLNDGSPQGNPRTNEADAIAFFGRMAAKYAGYGNVIYEVCNEPQNSPFASVIRPYAENVLAAIRKSAPRAVVLVGTNTWSQDVDEVIGNRLADPNVMYTLHFYAATHGDWIRQKLERALNAGVPVFVSECSITDASGNGWIDYASANQWLSLLNDNGVSFVAWSLSNKNESSALIAPGTQALSGWSAGQLSETGKWWRNAISAS